MTPDTIFEYCNTIALLGWLVLIAGSPFWMQFDKFIIGIVITLFAIVYAWLIANSFQAGDFEKFGSLDGVMQLFTNKTAVAAGWIHYLAFDLLTGIWIKKNSIKYNISHWLIIPCLLFTFMLGPVGFLLYIIIRSIVAKKYFAENY
ncbi:MAG: ABA4-like family protein [Chitinophagaceae bacterium]